VVPFKSPADPPQCPECCGNPRLLLPRYHKFESISLQRRVHKLSVPVRAYSPSAQRPLAHPPRSQPELTSARVSKMRAKPISTLGAMNGAFRFAHDHPRPRHCPGSIAARLIPLMGDQLIAETTGEFAMLVSRVQPWLRRSPELSRRCGEPSRRRSRPEPATDAMARVLIGAPD